MCFEEVKNLKVGMEIKFKKEGLICGIGYFTGKIIRSATDENNFTEIKYTGKNYGYSNIEPQDIICIINK